MKYRVRLSKAQWHRIESAGTRDKVISALIQGLFDYGMFEDMPPSEIRFQKGEVVSHVVELQSVSHEEWLADHDARDPTHSVGRAIVYALESGLLEEPDIQIMIGEKKKNV